MRSGKTYTIMLADDDPDDRDLFEEAVGMLQGAAIDIVSNGIRLMQKLTQNDALPDFLFLDLNMPEKSGKECLREIRGHERLKDLPVIIYSTSASRRDIEDTFAMGANLYITKPNTFGELKRIVASIMGIDWSHRKPGKGKDSFVFKL
jgi:CheY-like chemotaxis protein